MDDDGVIRPKVSRKLAPCLQPSRYKALYGGRGGGKSRFLAELMVSRHAGTAGLRSVCVREVQKSLKDSSKLLIEDQLREHGLGSDQGFRVTREYIETPGNGLIIFQGMSMHNAESIKSLEGFDIAWVEEAQTLSEQSLEMLRPTIRKKGSEIWFSWNPRLKTDPVDKLFRSGNLPTDAVVIRVNWGDNRFFPAELEQERQDDLRINPDQYSHIWDGEYVSVISGAYYAADLARARIENRICHIPADYLISYRAFWDIGGTGSRSDACAIWIAQFVGKEIRVLNYYEAVGQPLSAHVAWLIENGYKDAVCYLPHDGVQHDRVFDASYQSELARAGFSVITIPNQGKGAAMQRIAATRKIFAQLWFHVDRCNGGLQALGWYHEKRDPRRNIGLGPSHDWSSHAADAAGLMAIVADDIFEEQAASSGRSGKRDVVPIRYGQENHGWMG